MRELVGHGVGIRLHEKPEVPNYGKKGSGIQLKTGMVVAIEPMINAGKRNVKQLHNFSLDPVGCPQLIPDAREQELYHQDLPGLSMKSLLTLSSKPRRSDLLNSLNR